MEKKYLIFRTLANIVNIIIIIILFLISVEVIYQTNFGNEIVANVSFKDKYSRETLTLYFAIITMLVLVIPNIVALFLTFAQKVSGFILTLIVSFATMILSMWFFNITWVKATFLFLTSLLILLMVLATHFYSQQRDRFNPESYLNIITKSDRLVIFGGAIKIKKYAYEIANQLEAEIHELAKESDFYDIDFSKYREIHFVGNARLYNLIKYKIASNIIAKNKKTLPYFYIIAEIRLFGLITKLKLKSLFPTAVKINVVVRRFQTIERRN